MKKALIKGCVFIVTFIAALIVSSMLLNKGNTDMTAELELPKLPVVFVNVGEKQVNMMQGFLADMDEKYMRKSIMPVGEDRKMSFCVKSYGNEVQGLSFEVRSIDGERLVEDTPVTDYQRDGDVLRADIVLKDLIDKNTEYCLIFQVELSDGREASYYTRIIQAEGYAAEEKLDFVAEFSAATFHEEQVKDLKMYMEPNSEGDNTTFSRVTIHSSLEQLGWGKLDVKQMTEPVYTIQDITEQTAAITAEYIVEYPKYERETYAVVKEVYRIRTGTERMYLLDFERTMSEIFQEEAATFADDKIMLGILGTDVDMAESEGGKILAFVQGGALYCLNVTELKLSRLFSLYSQEGMDERALFSDHNFKLLQVDEAGNVIFMVYGYISRGRWEGYCGAEVYYYNSSTNTIEEMAFLPSSKSPEILEAEMDQLAFLNGKNELYIFLNDRISCVHLDSQNVDSIAENLSVDNCQVSASNQNIVWQNDGKKYASTSLTLMNLNSGEKTTIDAGQGCYVLPLGFMGEDLVYGVARQADVSTDYTGKKIFPMYQIRIQDENGSVLMSYEKPGVYVTECRMNGNQIILTRVEKDGQGGYVASTEDQIVSGLAAAVSSNEVITVPTEDYEKLTAIQLQKGIDNKKLKFLTPREVLYEGSREMEIPASEELVESYYVYDLDGEVTIASTPGEAIGVAYEKAGTVIGRNGSYIWRKERLNTKNQIMAIGKAEITEEKNSLAVCLDSILALEGVMRNSEYLLNQGKTIKEVLEDNLENVQVLDLSGCSLESVLYYPDREIPVLAILADGNAVLLTGFNEANVVVMDPAAGTLEKMGLNDAAAWFEENGNVFIAYVKG